MKYELKQSNWSAETVIDDDAYSVDFTLAIKPTDDIAPMFTKTVTVTSSNAQTGYEVDAQREQAITDYMISINQ